MRFLSRATRGEEGSALVLALFFSIIFFVLLEAVMTFAEVGLRSTKSFQDQLTSATTSSSAMDAGINRYRADSKVCGDEPAPLTPDMQPIGGKNVIIHCATTQSVNRPDDALLALGGDTGEGIVSDAAPAGAVTGVNVRGNVFSNSRIDGAANRMTVAGDVGAVGTCNNVTVDTSVDPNFAQNCAPGGPSAREDPDFSKAADVVPPRRTVPACASGQWLITLQPGYYDDPLALSDRTNHTNPDCFGAVVWLQPGIYYFDFGFLTNTPGAGVWTINDDSVAVVAGTPTFDTTSATRPAFPLPGSCKTEADAPPVSGVQVIMGGKSRVQVDGGAKVELCAHPSTTDQQIALYGLKPEQSTHTLAPTAATQVDGFTNSRNAFAIGNPVATADARLAPSGPTSATLKVSGFAPAVSAGAVINSAKLRIAHRDDGVAAPTVSFAGNTCTDPSPVPLSPGVISEYQLDLKSCGVSTPASLNGLTVTYRVGAGSSAGTESLDGLVVEVDYATPETRKATEATTTAFSDPSNAIDIGDGAVATATLSDGGPATASLTLTGYGEPPIPPGSTIQSAVLRIAHQDTGDIDGSDVTVSLPGVGTCSNIALSAHRATVGDDRRDVKACGLNTSTALEGLSVAYNVGLKSGGSSATELLDGIVLELSYSPPSPAHAPALASSVAFTNPDNAKAVGEQPTPLTADASLRDSGPATASLTVSDFHLPAVPPGSFIDSATLRLVHQYSGNTGTATMTASFPGNTCTAQPVLTTSATPTFDLKACGLSTAFLSNPDILSAVSATYDVGLAAAAPPLSATDKVDGIVLDIAYRPPAVRVPATAASALFGNPGNAKVVGEQPTPLTADANLSDAGPATAALTVADFHVPPLPPGSSIDSALVRVVHHYTGDAGTATLTATFTGNTCSPQPIAVGVDDVGLDLKPCGLSGAALAATSSLLTTVSATYSVGLTAPGPASAIDKVDGIELDLVFRPPAFEPMSGCLDHASGTYNPATPTTTCAVLSTTPGASGDRTVFASQGTVYTPSVAVDISLADVPSQVLTRGVIARTIRLGAAAGPGVACPSPQDATKCSVHPVSLSPPKVNLTAYPANGTASTQSPANASAAGFSNPDNAKAIDEQPTRLTSDANVSSSGSATATLTVSDFSTPAVPAGSAIDFAVLRINHVESGDAGQATVTATVPPSPSSPQKQCTFRLPVATGLSEARLDLRSQICGVTTSDQLTGLKVEYTANLAPGGTSGTDSVDGFALDITSRPPTKREASTVMSDGFSNPQNATSKDGATSDAALDATGSGSASLSLTGFGPLPVADGSALSSAVLHVAHADDPNVAPTVTTSFEGDGHPAPYTLPAHGAMQIEDIDLRAAPSGLADPAAISGLSVTYQASLSSGTATDRVDAIWLDVTVLSGPTLRATAEYDPETDHLVVTGWSVIR